MLDTSRLLVSAYAKQEVGRAGGAQRYRTAVPGRLAVVQDGRKVTEVGALFCLPRSIVRLGLCARGCGMGLPTGHRKWYSDAHRRRAEPKVPEAFGRDGVIFGVAFLIARVMQLALFALAGRGDKDLMRAILQLAPFSLLGAALILTAGFVHGWVQWVLWLGAVFIGLFGPLLARTRGWRVEPAHFIERHGQNLAREPCPRRPVSTASHRLPSPAGFEGERLAQGQDPPLTTADAAARAGWSSSRTGCSVRVVPETPMSSCA